jgi:hypothetical protein
LTFSICNLRRIVRFIPALAVMAALTVAAPARADFTPWYTDSIAVQSTDWSHTVSLTKFDPSLGTLTGIEVTLMGTVLGNIKVSNLSGSSSNTITADLASTIILSRPDSSLLVTVLPDVQTVDTFDANLSGSRVFSAPYGRTHTGVSATSTNTLDLIPPSVSDAALFTGLGSIVLNVDAIGASSSSDTAGNYDKSLRTSAAATVEVRYEYTLRSVPEPSSLILIGLGGLGLLVRRRQMKKA